MSDHNSVFQEVQAAMLNSECDPNEAGKQGLCALYSFVATETEGSKLHKALDRVLGELGLTRPPIDRDVLPRKTVDVRKTLRKRVLASSTGRGRKR